MLKKSLTAIVATLIVVGGISYSKPGTVVLKAQSLPITKTIAWDANPSIDGVIDYTVRLNGIVVGTPTTTTSQAVTFTTQGPQTITVTARNTWGTGPAGTLNVDVRVPGAPTNIRIP